jgi:hypothetical protein
MFTCYGAKRFIGGIGPTLQPLVNIVSFFVLAGVIQSIAKVHTARNAHSLTTPVSWSAPGLPPPWIKARGCIQIRENDAGIIKPVLGKN